MKHVIPVIALIFLLVGSSGCSETTSVESGLVAHLTLSVDLRESYAPLSVDFALDPTMTVTSFSPLDSLEVRWDVDDDGEWDTDFRRLRIMSRAWMPHIPFTTWYARCEVRDKMGNTSIAADSLSMPLWAPKGADLVAGELFISNSYVMTGSSDTLLADSKFYISMSARMWDDYFTVKPILRCYIDGELLSAREVLAGGPFYLMDNLFQPQGPFPGLEPGVHQIEAELVVPEGLTDVDTANNRRSRTVIFVEGDN